MENFHIQKYAPTNTTTTQNNKINMSYTFIKLFSSITDSSIWCEDSDTKVVWVTMMAMTDEFGRVHASVNGLAKRSGVSLEKTQECLKKFMSPDEFSRTSDNEGRRIEEIHGGWRLLNYDYFKKLRHDEDRKEQVREAVARHRKKCNHAVNNVIKCNQSKPNADGEAYLESNTCAEEDCFQRFWKEYPKKQAKKEAFACWVKLNPNAEMVEKIMSGLESWKKSEMWTKDGGQFIMQAQKFLRNCRWEDEVCVNVKPVRNAI